MDTAHLDYMHSMTLDTRGPEFLPELESRTSSP
jgi:hypothetical protein